ncbi:MAG: LLM class flavin-dependent oxidoreductase [Gordonia sp. (in: high G+C Gram-positive bacteria)]
MTSPRRAPLDSVSPIVLIALSRSTTADLVASSRAELTSLGRQLDHRAHAVIIGSDLVGSISAPNHTPAATGIDPTIAAITLAQYIYRAGLIVAAAPQRDHPYNLARRLASLDHATRGRIGLAIATTDPAAPDGSPWTTASPDIAAADAVVAIRDLWRSFPVDAIVADHQTGVFSHSERIVAIDHRGAFDITGPLQVPTSPQLLPPVLAWRASASAATTDTTVLTEVADLIVDESDERFRVYTPRSVSELRDLLAEIPGLDEHPDHGDTLRERLGLPDAAPLAAGAGRPVFTAPSDADSHEGVSAHAR